MDDKSSKDGTISKVEKNRKPGKPKGLPKTGGRQVGTPNRKTLVFAEAIEAAGFDLEQSIVSLFNSTNDDYVKLALINMVAKYKLPIPKPREIDSEEDESTPETSELNTNNILKLTNGEKE